MDDTLLYYETEESDPFLPQETLTKLRRLSKAIPLFIISYHPFAHTIAKNCGLKEVMGFFCIVRKQNAIGTK